MLQIYKVDREYIILRKDEPIPAKGERFYHVSARAALADLRRETLDVGAAAGARLSDVEIGANEHADAATIRSFGFAAI